MIREKELLRNHMIAATMHRRWETLAEILRAIRSDGVHCVRRDAWTWLLELSKDGVHTLQHRVRAGAALKEYRLFVKENAVMKTRRFDRTPLATKNG